MRADHEASEAASTVYAGKCSPEEMPYLYLPTILNYVKPATRSLAWGSSNAADIVGKPTLGPNNERLTTKGCACKKEWGGYATDDGTNGATDYCTTCTGSCSRPNPSPNPNPIPNPDPDPNPDPNPNPNPDPNTDPNTDPTRALTLALTLPLSLPKVMRADRARLVFRPDRPGGLPGL